MNLISLGSPQICTNFSQINGGAANKTLKVWLEASLYLRMPEVKSLPLSFSAPESWTHKGRLAKI